jgi:2-polyprenyl-6-methoxyphenol hydroxylase-like FAD-dependent oxidoreductase
MDPSDETRKKVLISGGGIAGLTLGILLREKGWGAMIVERDPAIRTEGYVIDFFGSGWDVAERMGLARELQQITYPIDSLRYVDANGKPYLSLPVQRVRDALDGKYTYLRRSDLERILFERANMAGVTIRFGTTITSLEDHGETVMVAFSDGLRESFGLVFGADGAHSRVRELAFGPESQFERFLGYYVAAFHLDHHPYNIGTSLTIYEEPGRSLWTYSLGQGMLSAMFIFKRENLGYVPPQKRLPLLKQAYRGAGWIAENILNDVTAAETVFFDSTTQIVMPSWSTGRVALLGDACACLTLLAGQGSHLAMAEAYVIATELDRYGGDYLAAFIAYQKTLKSATLKKQRAAVRISRFFVPSKRSLTRLRRMVERLFFSDSIIRYGFKFFGVKSVLKGYQ